MQNTNRFGTFLKSHKGFIVILVSLLLVIFLLSRYGFISVEVSGQQNGEFVYQLKNQASGKTTEIKTNSNKVSRFVRRGTYEVVVTQKDAGSFSVASTPGFLRKKSVQNTLKPELARQFVGNNPRFCLFYAQQALYSYECRASTEFTRHVPATSSTPTYVTETKKGVYGEIEDTIDTDEGAIVLFKFNGSANIKPHTAFIWSPNSKTSDGIALSDLNPTKDYDLLARGKGFLAYTSDFSEIYSYSSLRSKPQRIQIEESQLAESRPVSIAANEKSVVVLYSTQAEDEIIESEEQKPAEDNQADIVVSTGGTARRFVVDGNYSTAKPCGDMKLCLVGDGSLSVYSIKNDKAEFLYRVMGVTVVETIGDDILVYRDKEMLRLDANTGSGSIAYNYGDYAYCGSESTLSYQLVCLINSKNKRVVLRLDHDKENENTDSVDKDVAELLKLSEVRDVSIQRNFIYISPEIGELGYNPQTQQLEYDETKKQNAKQKIDQKINELGIDKSRYFIKINLVD